MDNYPISMFFTDAWTKTLPIQMLQYVEERPDPTIAAISAGLVLLAIVALVIGDRNGQMKILVANPNTSTGVTDRLVTAGKLVSSPGTELLPMTAPRGVPYIATRAEAAIGSAMMLEMLAERRGTFDAAIVAAFGDPGLEALQAHAPVPVVGICEASRRTAAQGGRRFAVATVTPDLVAAIARVLQHLRRNR
eukprot:gene13514-17248_t